jgi:hypothetical protein
MHDNKMAAGTQVVVKKGSQPHSSEKQYKSGRKKETRSL